MKFLRMGYETLLRMGYEKFLGMGYNKFLGMNYEKYLRIGSNIFLENNHKKSPAPAKPLPLYFTGISQCRIFPWKFFGKSSFSHWVSSRN